MSEDKFETAADVRAWKRRIERFGMSIEGHMVSLEVALKAMAKLEAENRRLQAKIREMGKKGKKR